MNPSVSVIIPVYNAEKSLSEAIDSVISQTRKDIEIVIINDGSIDSSPEIIERYVKEDSRIIYINKENNEGLSAARNSGLEVVSGEYFTFLDADDRLEADYYEKVLSEGKGADIIVTGYYHDTLNEDRSLSVSVENRTKTALIQNKSDIVAEICKLDRKRLFAYTWNKLYKKDFIDSLGVKFENQTLIEDYLYNCTVFSRINTLALVDGCFYHYIKFSKEALTQKYQPEYFSIMDKRYMGMKNILLENNVFDGENRSIVCSMHIKHVIAGIMKNFSEKAGLSQKEQRRIIKGLFRNENCAEAIKYAKGTRKQEVLCNIVFATRNVSFNFVFAKLLYELQNSKNHVFDKVK